MGEGRGRGKVGKGETARVDDGMRDRDVMRGERETRRVWEGGGGGVEKLLGF